MSKFLIILTGDRAAATLRGTPLRLQPYDTDDEIAAALAWQVKGGHDRAGLCVAVPDSDLPGVMRAADGRPVLVRNEGWTDEAYARFIVNLWGHLCA